MSTPGASEQRADNQSRPQSTLPDTPQENASPVGVTNEQHESDAKEIRLIAQEYANVDLLTLCPIARQQESEAHSERYRTVFGYLWLSKACEALPDVAVPRNTIYAAYVELCARERLKALTSAGFGRCVRIAYPEVSTRRLGVRGESKYHYCGIRLIGDETGLRTANQVSVRKERQREKENRRKPRLGAALQDVFSATQGKHVPGRWMQDLEKDVASQPVVPIKQISSVDFSGLQRPTVRLVFLTPEVQAEIDDSMANDPEAFDLPDIYDYLPDNADADVQDSLGIAYRAHCRDLIEALASMKIRHFIELNSSFYHSLSTEIQQLLSTPSLATWIQKADLAMYQQITTILTPLCHQVIPPEIFLLLRNLVVTLLPNIHQSLASYAPHLLQAKLIPAGQFASLLARLLRVNETAHAAARFLTNSADRELMKMDWIRFVDPKAIAYRELSCGEEEVAVILDEILNLLGPSKSNKGAPQLSSPSPQKEGFSLMQGVEFTDASTPQHNGGSKGPGEPVLDLWSKYLSSLPHRFPRIEARLFLLCMGAVASSVLRDITVAGGEGFGALWVVKCWVDEMMRFLCERGGFLLEQVYDQFDDDDDDGDMDFAFNFNHNAESSTPLGSHFLFGGGQVEPLLDGQHALGNGWGIGLGH